MTISPFTLKERLMFLLQKKPWSNIKEMTENLGQQRPNVRDKLYLAKREGFVRDTFSHKITPTGGRIMVHIWTLTSKGLKWVKEHKTQ